MRDIQGILGDPKFLMGLSLLNAGNPQGGYGGILNTAMGMNQLQNSNQNNDLQRSLTELQIQKARKDLQPRDPRSTLGKINPKDYTPDSFTQYLSTGDASVLRSVMDQNATAPIIKSVYEGNVEIQQQWNPEKQKWEEVGRGPRWAPQQDQGGYYGNVAYSYDQGGNPVMYQPKKSGGFDMFQLTGEAPVQYDPNRQATLKTAETTASKTSEENVAQHDAVIKASDNIYKIDGLINHLQTSDAITGLGADIFKNIERAKVLLGGKAAKGKVSDTELLDALLGSEVFPMIGALDIGARGMDTPAEREFMRKVLTGEISLNKDTLLKMAQIRKEISLRSVQRWNKRVESGELDKYFEFSGRPKGKIEYSDTGAPAQEDSGWQDL